MDALIQDVRYAVRALSRRRGFTVVAVVTLALGIGATTALFSVLSHVLLRPLPLDDPDRIVQVWNPWSNEPGEARGRSPMASLDVADISAEVGSFERLGAYGPQVSVNLTGSDTPQRVRVRPAAADLWDVLGVAASLGRTFTAEEDARGRSDVVVLSHALWQSRFGGSPAAVGSTIRLDGVAHTVLGVMPPSFRLPEDYGVGAATDVWRPLALDPRRLDRDNAWLHVLARLKDGSSVAAANAELEALTERWIEEGLKVRALPPYYAVPVEEEVFGDVRPALWMLFGAVAFVLLIACVNVANLLLARADGRERELAVRAALGGTRLRVVGQLLVESTVLGLAGGALGLLLATLGVRMLIALDPADIPRLAAVRIDAAVLGFGVIAALSAGVLAGVAPALQASRPDLGEQLRSSGRSATASASRQRFRGGLVTAEIALSVILVIGAVLMIRTVRELSGIDLGFGPDRVLTFGVSLPAADYPEPHDHILFYEQLRERVAALPGARSTGAVWVLPLAASLGGGSIEIEGAPPRRPGEGPANARWQVATPGYFEAMDYDLVAGRFLAPADRMDGLPVVVINETMAAMFWPDAVPEGKRVRRPGDDMPWFTVVGVVRDIRHSGLTDVPSPTLYFPHQQFPLMRAITPADMTVVVRTSADPLALAGGVREVVASLDPDLPISNLRPMDDVVDDALAQPRFTMLLLSLFGGLALALAVIGIYGVLSYAVSLRRKEIGIRVALGASRDQVLRLVLRAGVRLAGAGVAAGILAALLLTRLMQSLVYGVRPLDPATFLLVPALFAVVALAASYVPARAAARVDPMVAFRQE